MQLNPIAFPRRDLLRGVRELSILSIAVAVAYMERSVISHLVPFMMADAGHSHASMGYVLAAFGVGYVVGLPFSGILIGRIGHRRTLALIAVTWAVAACWFAASDAPSGLAAARFLLGLAEAPLFPLFVSWISTATQDNTTSYKIGIVEAASYVGMAVSGPLAVSMAMRLSWQWAYLGMGLLALVVVALSVMLRPPQNIQPPTATPEPRRSESIVIRGPPSSHGANLYVGLGFCAIGFLLYNFSKTFYSTWLLT